MSASILAFGGLGPVELVVIGLVCLLVFGRRLPEVARSLGQGLTEFRKGLRDDPRDAPQPLPEPTTEDLDGEADDEDAGYPEVADDPDVEPEDEADDEESGDRATRLP